MGILEKVKRKAKVESVDLYINSLHDIDSSNGRDEELDTIDGIPCLSKQLAVPKVSEISSQLGRASTSGLGRAVDAIYGLGSSMANLNTNSGFTTGATAKGTKISILAFEVANITVKGSNLMQSLSTYNIKHVKEVVLPSEGVQNLVSRNMDELLRIVAADKREELKILSGEVARFGNCCKDPQWHNLDRHLNQCSFSNCSVTREKLLKEDAEVVMQQLMMLASNTNELYHELYSLDKFENEYRCKHQEQIENPETCQRDSLAILRAELKNRRRLMRSLKRNSFWRRMFEEVVEKLVHVVRFLHKEIHHKAFSNAGTDDEPVNDSPNNHKTLGSAGLALHYANTITQIHTLVSRSSSVPSNTRDTLYQGLPPAVKSALRSKLQSFQLKEEHTIAEIKAQMEKTLRWLVPVATSTTKAHHGFGWVGEWANTGSEMNRKPAGQTDLLRIETLHHADKNRTESYILELVVWLHHLINRTRVGNCGIRSPVKSPLCSPNQKAIQLCMNKTNCSSPILTVEDLEMLRYVSKRKLTPGIVMFSVQMSYDAGFNMLNLVNIEKLNGNNFNTWKQQIEMNLEMLEFNIAFKTQPTALVDGSTAQEREHCGKWERANQMSLLIMQNAMEEHIRDGISSCDLAKDYLARIEEKFKRSDTAEVGASLSALINSKHDGLSSVREHLLKMVNISCNGNWYH